MSMSSINRRRGSAVLDLALTLGVLLSLSFGTVEFGYFFYVKNVFQGAAREGARAAIVPTAVNSDVTTAVSNALTAANLQNTSYTVTITPSNISGLSSGTQVTVQVSCAWGSVGVSPLRLIGSTKQVVGVVVMRRE